MTKRLVKKILPPILLDVLKARKTHGWFGNYENWHEAATCCEGYSKQEILEKVRQALILVAKGQKTAERDSVLFDHIEYSWPLLAALLYVASLNQNSLSILDFGGSLGTSYYQNIGFLSQLSNLRWSIVEQDHFVNCGQAEFQNENLRFYRSVDECLKKERPIVLLFSGVLQYLPDPYVKLRELLKHRIPFTLFDRTGFSLNNQQRLTIQITNPRIYKASYPCWFFAKPEFLSYFSAEHDLLAEFSCDFDGFNREYEQSGLKHLGFFLKRKDLPHGK